MNKQYFRVIFSKTLQRLVVVSELAKSEGKSTESSPSGQILQKICKIRPLVFSLFYALGFVTFSQNAFAENLIIQADSSASKNQQPIILQTANGLPQVNIQTPNDKGLSHNKYSQFDVAEKGAILNNSRTTTQTQQAGLVQGNPYLARGEAKVILNEVNSNKPSVMKGYVEVAGKKADVIIANPSGLHCEGCGIINSDRATFTTGKPEIKNGQVDNFKIEAGKVKVSGKGLDNSRVDYTEILAREAEVNAGIWSKKETKVITGKNTIKRSETDKNLQIINTKQPLANEDKPQVAIDVGELGGMYSGKIHLIGTEKGVGVRNTGHIGASSETLQIDSQGRIVNTGTLNAAKPVTLTASQGIENKGKIENKQGDIQLTSKSDIQNSGSMVARGGNIQQKAETQIHQSGEAVAKGNIRYTAKNIEATKDSLIAAGVNIQDGKQGGARQLEEKSAQGKSVHLVSQGKITAQGKNIASGKITISATEIDANLIQNNAYTIEYTAKSGDIQADNARLTAEQIHLTTPNLLSTQGSFLTANVINTSQKSLNAQNAVWKQTGEQDFRLTGERINTQGSEFSTQGNFFINAKQLDNQQGTLSSGKSLYLDLKGHLNSADGKLFAGENLRINSQNLNNDSGLIYAKQKIGIAVKNGLVSNKNTNSTSTYKGIIAGKELLLESQTLDNTKGQITSENIRLMTSQINNEEGAIRAEHNVDIHADILLNHKGILSSAQKANLTVSEINQQKGIIEAQHLQLNSNNLASTENSLIFAEQLNLTTKGELNNQNSRIVAKKGAYVTTGGNVTNIGGVIGSKTADLQLNTHNHQINNTAGKIVAAQQLNLQSSSLLNEQGFITANNIRLDTNNGSLNNQNTLTGKKDKGIIARQNLALNTKVLDNQMGNVLSFNTAQLNTSEIINNSGQIRISGNLDIQSKNLSQKNGLITADKTTLTLSELNSSQNSEISANEITLNADKVANQNSRLQANKSFTLEAKQGITNRNGIIASKTDSLTINTHQSTLDNANGTLFANQVLNIQSGKLDNRAGLISAKQTEINTQQNQIDNRNTQAENKGIIGLDKLSLNHLSVLNNEQGFIHSNKQLAVSATSNINNQQGILNSKENLTLNAEQIDNKAGTISAKTAEVNAKAIDNNAVSDVGSLILGTTQLVLNVEQLANQNTKRKHTDKAPTQGIQAGQLTLNSNMLSNQQGGVYVADVAMITVNQTLNNLQGELLSDNELTIKDNGNLSLNNQEGLIQAKNRINLTAKTLENEGSIKTEGDLTVRLKDSFTLNNTFEVGNDLDFSTRGDFTNNVALLIGNRATLSANQIINTASGEISSKNSKLTAKEITNRGLIDGEKTLLNASKIKNIGTGRIYGDHLSLKGQNINNIAEVANGKSHAATIAARKRLDFGVGTLTNRDHSLILSLGEMAIGGDLDSEGSAIGKADFVDNGSATIEVLGNVQLGIKEAINQDIHLKESFEESEKKHLNYMREYTDANGKTTRTDWFRHGVDGIYHRYNGHKSGHTRFIFFDRNKQDPNAYSNGSQDFWFEQDYLRKTKTPTYYDASPAKFLVGGILSIDGEEKMLNKYSHILVGDRLILNGKHFTENEYNKSLIGNGFSLVNQDLERKIIHYDLGKETIYKFERRPTKRKWRHKNFREPMGDRDIDEYSYEDINFNLIQNVIGISPQYTGNKIGEKVEANNVSLDTISITGDNIDSKGSTVNITLTPTLNDKDKNTIVNSGQVIGKLDTTIDNFDPDKFGELTLPTIKTHLADVTLPQASLYKINPDATNGYLVETDPKFTDRKQWLSSDYMFEQLRHNHDNVHKRLGDGFYEQRLINEQINQLTGRRFIQGYANDLEQYKALMNSGVKYAKQFDLAVGVGLTAKQMSELTTDMVWLVNKEVTLIDGRKVTALVPQVYLVARNSDITSRGAVISANQIIGSADKVENSGVIAGLDLTRLHSNQLENRGVMLGNTVDLSVTQNLINLGGKIEAVKDLSLYAGKNLEISSTLSSSQSTDGNFARTVLDQLASVKVTGEGGRLALHSDDNLTIKAANIESEGTLTASADKTLNITTLNVSNKEHYNGNADNYYRLDQQGEIGSTLRGKDGVRLVGMENATFRQATVSSENGDTFIGSKGDVRIESGVQSEQLASSSKGSTKGWFSKTTETRRHYHNTTENIRSEVDGKNVTIYSETGKVDIHGSAVVADKQLLIDGKAGVNITSATNTHYTEEEHIKTKSGLMGTGGIGFSVGKKKEQIEQDHTQQSAARSQVGNLSGDTIIRTDGHYQQTGSIVTSRDGDVDITAKSANITAARSDYESNYKRTYEQKGVTIAVNIPVVQAIQAVDSAVKSAKTVGDSKNNRINAMAAANTGFEAMRAVDQIMKIDEAISNGSLTGGAVGVSLTYGQQKSVQTQHSEGNTAEKSQINAGGKVNIQTAGSGKDSHITIAGSDVAGLGGTHLKADGKVSIEAADENHLERSKNKSSGFNVGVAIQFGNGVSAGITAGGNVAKGYGNGESQAWLASQVGDKNSKTTIESGSDTNIIGSQVRGKRVELTAEHLNIQSLQDTAKYEGKQESASAQVTVGYGFSASGSYNNSKAYSNYANVKTQAGIFAGDDGYDVDIRNHTDLKGGTITSTEQAEQDGKNRFTTNTLTYQDIYNHSDYSAKGFGLNGGFSVSGGEAPKEIAGVKLQQIGENHKDGSSKVEMSGVAGAASQGNRGVAKLATALLGQASDKGSEDGITTASINTKNIIIRDKQAQQQLTGKTAGETVKEINKANIHQEVNKADIEQIKADVERDLKTATDFVENLHERGDEIYYKMEKNEDSVFSVQKKTEDCNHISCLDFKADNSQELKQIIYGDEILTDEQAQLLSKVATAGMLNLEREDKVSSAILYDRDLTSIDETAVILNRGSAGVVNEVIFTGFERLRAWANMPSVFGASNATRDHAQINKKLEEYNAHRISEGKSSVSANNVAHSLGVSGNKNMLNWSEYVGNEYKNTKINFSHLGGSYPSAEIDKQAKELFSGVNTEYHGAKGDFVYSGIGGWFIGNNPNARQVEGLGFGQAHSEANQNINNLKYIYKLEENGNKEKKWADVYEMLKNTYPNGIRKFNKLSEKE